MFRENLLDSLFSKIMDEKSRFVKALMRNDEEEAIELANSIYKRHPEYLILFCFLYLIKYKRLLPIALKKTTSLDLNLIYLLAKSPEIEFFEFKDVFKQLNGSSFIELCIRRETLFKKYNYTKEIDLTEFKDLMLALDDYSLYDFALRNKLEIQQKDTLNYKCYSVAKNKDFNNYKDIIKSTADFEMIKNLTNMYLADSKNITKMGDVQSQIDRIVVGNISDLKKQLIVENPGHSILVDFLHRGFDMQSLKNMYDIYQRDQTFFNFKVLLAYLISSKKENLLILAFYLTSDFYEKSDNLSRTLEANYEIQLIHLFLNRYFLFHNNIKGIFKKLDIKNIQLINLSYIWSDPMIRCNLKFKDLIEGFNQERYIQLDECVTGIKNCIAANRIAHAASFYKLSKRIKDSVLNDEINGGRIISVDSRTMFSNLLGEFCTYLFDKVTEKDVIGVSGCIETLKSNPASDINDKIFINEVLNISDSKFIQYFKNLIKNQSPARNTL